MATDYGYDLALDGTDFDPMFPEVSGRVVLAQALARRFATPRGALNFEPFPDPSYGYDLRELIGEGFDSTDLVPIQAAIAAEARKDERVHSARAEVQLSSASGTCLVRLTIATEDGPFRLVLGVDSLSVAILEVT